MSSVVKGFWCAFFAIWDTQALVSCVAINRGSFVNNRRWRGSFSGSSAFLVIGGYSFRVSAW